MTTKLKIVAYKNKLVMVPTEPETRGKAAGWYPTIKGETLGCVLIDSKTRLAASKQALKLLQRIKLGIDAIGDVGWWKCDDGTFAFSYFGSIHRIVDPDTAEAARDFKVFADQCTIVPNSVPKAAKAAIDAGGGPVYAWQEPHCFEPDQK